MASSTQLENFVLSDEDALSPSRVNQIIRNFVDNDDFVFGRFGGVPAIWECLWYNNERLSGYSRGTFFWVNTEQLQTFIANAAEKIKEYADLNPYIEKKLPDWQANDEEVFNEYYNVLTGYSKPTMTKHCPPVFYIGELSGPAQVIVSQKNNNMDVPNEVSSAWKRFTIEESDYDDIIKKTYSGIDEIMSAHIRDYHFSNEKPSEEISASLSNYADENFFNVEINTTNYIENGNHSTGFDVVDYFVKRPYPNRTLSGLTLENQWFRLWKSGYLEHGGIIDTRNFIGPYGDRIVVPFNWNLFGGDSKIYEMKFLGEGDEAVEIDESQDVPPGDNLISVLYELEKDDFKINGSDKAPFYENPNYTVTVVPCYPNVALQDTMDPTPSYENLGDNSTLSANVVSTNIVETTVSSFSFSYDSENTPRFYSYYIAGFSIP